MSLIPRCAQCDAPLDPYGRDGGHSWCNSCRADAEIAAFNSDPKRPFDNFYGQIVPHRARRPILATDCDFEIVTVSGVQGRRIAA